jgi:hypothetical protein
MMRARTTIAQKKKGQEHLRCAVTNNKQTIRKIKTDYNH